jgi:CubicO group peptidase (beta-lactamase class C family)
MGQNPTLTDAEYIAMLRHLKPNLGFRDEFQYQNQLFAMLGCVASTVMGRPFEEILQDELLTPLGLADTAMADREMMDGGNSALPYRINERRGFHKLGYTPDAHADYPAGNLVSSLSDMLRYLRFHMQDGMLDGCAIVAQDALRETHTNQIAQQPGIGVEECTDLFYCLGWNAANYRGRRILYHSGDYKGYATNISFMPEHDIGIVFLSNLDQNLLGEALHLNIYDLLLEDGITDFNDHYMQVQAAMFQAYKNEAERAMAQREDIPMTNPLDDYAGVYSGNGITGMEVRVVDGALVCDYHGFIVELAHLQHNAFIGYIEDFEAYVPVSFLSDSEGNIVSLVFMLPPSQGSIMTIDKVH